MIPLRFWIPLSLCIGCTASPPVDTETGSSDIDWSLGEVIEGQACTPPGGVPAPTTCQELTIRCPSTEDREVNLLTLLPPGTQESRGVVILGSGGTGTTFYPAEFTTSLHALGFTVLNRMWQRSWVETGNGTRAASCRYATLLTWIRAQAWSEGPLCATGNSGGSAEIAYGLTRWDRGEVLDLAVLSGGPPMARLDLGCIPELNWGQNCTDLVDEAACDSDEISCLYGGENTAVVDSSFHGNPCQDAGPEDQLREHSILSLDASLSYPNTAVHFIQGTEDCTISVPQGYLYSDAIETTKSVQVVQAPHGVFSTQEGAEAIVSTIDSECVCRHDDCSPTAKR